MKKNVKRFSIFIFVMVFLDQITKYIFLKNGKALAPVGEQNNAYYILVSIIIVIMIIRYMSSNNTFIKSDTKIILSFATAGAIGNVIDRILRGYVICFIKLGDFFNVNLAYIYVAISWIGMAAILTKNSYIFLKNSKEKRKKIEERK